jgi:hypothetical protein
LLVSCWDIIPKDSILCEFWGTHIRGRSDCGCMRCDTIQFDRTYDQSLNREVAGSSKMLVPTYHTAWCQIINCISILLYIYIYIYICCALHQNTERDGCVVCMQDTKHITNLWCPTRNGGKHRMEDRRTQSERMKEERKVQMR